MRNVVSFTVGFSVWLSYDVPSNFALGTKKKHKFADCLFLYTATWLIIISFVYRLFPVFHAYMAGIVQVLDQNQEWGSELLNLTLQLLLFCAAPKPQKRTQTPAFSLVRIPPHMRQTWLMACLIILYKVNGTMFPSFEHCHSCCWIKNARGKFWGDLHRLQRLTRYMVGRENKRTNNRTMLPALKNNAAACC